MHVDQFHGDSMAPSTNSDGDTSHSSTSTTTTYSNQQIDSVQLPITDDSNYDSNAKNTFRGGGPHHNHAYSITPGGKFGHIQINRSPMSLASLEQSHPPEENYRARRELLRRMLPEKWSACSTLRSVFPILKWFPNYNARQDLPADIVAGITVLALQIPQGLAYSRLAGVDPKYGLFGTFYSMIAFSLMSTSRHASMGLYAITSMMCHGVVLRYNASNPQEDPIAILVTLCLMTGVIQMFFGMLRLGNLSLLFSDNFLSAFSVGCTVLILNSQVPPTLGISFDANENDSFKIPSECINTWISIGRHLPEVGVGTFLLSCGVLASLVITKYYVEPIILAKKLNSKLTVPIDLIVIIATVILSMVFTLSDKGIETVGIIPSTFPVPEMPNLSLMPALFMDAIIMAVVASVCQISMSKILAKKYGYRISLNQEFLAYGTTNVFCSFFHCFPTCASLARTNVNENAGARTQMSTIVTTTLLVVFLMFFTTYLGPLPKATLSCIIIVAMIPSLVMAKDFFTVLYVSRFDAVLWLVTFLTVTFLGVNAGIYCGLVTSIAIILIRAAIPTSSIKYPLALSELYFPPNVFNGLNSHSLQKRRVAVFSFNGPLTFLSAATFRTDVRRLILHSNPCELLDADSNNNTKSNGHSGMNSSSHNGSGSSLTPSTHSKMSRGSIALGKRQILKTLILDMSQINYIDVTGIEMLNDLKDELMEQRIRLLLACPSISVLSTLDRAQFFRKTLPKEHCFLSIIDGVTFASEPNATVPYIENACLITLPGYGTKTPKQ